MAESYGRSQGCRQLGKHYLWTITHLLVICLTVRNFWDVGGLIYLLHWRTYGTRCFYGRSGRTPFCVALTDTPSRLPDGPCSWNVWKVP